MTRNDIIRGRGIVPWSGGSVAREGFPNEGERFAPGWVLPGGERTLDADRAARVAEAIHSLLADFDGSRR